ncbi:MAG: Enoyl-[acyl-carrier-protein] reductase [Bryobacterales bacterium]|nr:Enoyl-[acyl-carrier-protein] reductase [Bryobacterales bacterium]
MANLLEGKTALVMGIANKWSIAYAIAQAFSREGASLILTYINEKQKESIEAISSDLRVEKMLPCNVTNDEQLAALKTELESMGKPLDVAVHCLAFANPDDLSRPFVETSRAGFLLAQEVSAYSLVAVARAAAGAMTNGGALMTLTYLGSTRVVQNYNVMGAAKASLEAAVRYLAADLGPSNIRVNGISAGAVKTASLKGIKGASALLTTGSEKAPLRRNTDPAEVADTAVFLASDLGRGVTGNVIFVDAGMQIMGL